MARKLTPKQQRFVQEYLVDLNQSAAARRAGYSERTANEQAAQLMKDPRIQSAIQAAMKSRAKRMEITQDAVLQQLAKIAFADYTDFVEWDNDRGIRFKSSDEQGVDGTVVDSVTEMWIGDMRKVEFRLANKMKALELLGKHLGLFSEKLKVDMDVSLADVLLKAWSMAGEGNGDNGGH